MQPRELCSPELARHLSEASREIGRQIGVLLNRRGEVEYVIVGDARQIELPDVGRARAGQLRLRGLRLVHTHLKDEPLTRDDLTDLILLRLDAVAALVARDDGLPGKVYLATLLPFNPGGDLYRQEQAPSVPELQFDALASVTALEQEMARAAPGRAVGSEGRALLVGAFTGSRQAAEDSMTELRELSRTAGVEVLDFMLQGRKEIDPRTVVGEGKLQEILVRSMALGADLLVFVDRVAPRLQGRTHCIVQGSALGRHSHDGGGAGDSRDAGVFQRAFGGHKSAEEGSGLVGREGLLHPSVRGFFSQGGVWANADPDHDQVTVQSCSVVEFHLSILNG